MGISHEVIIKKMTEELENAKLALAAQKEWQTSIAHVKLLSELLLEEKSTQINHTAPTIETVSKTIKKEPEKDMKQTPDHDEGTSIFDF